MLSEAQREGDEPQGVDAIDLLRYLMDDRGMNASDLGRLLGDRSLGPKLLHGDRGLSKSHIRKLADYFSISPALFL